MELYGNKSKVKAVIFDMDGVVFDTEKFLCKFWRQAAEEYGFPMTMEQAMSLRSYAKKFAEPYLKSIFGEGFDYYTVRARRMALMRKYYETHEMEIKRGIIPLLDYLNEKGITVAMATATDYERASGYLKKGGIFERFNQIVCASMVESGKPMPDIYLYAAEKIGFKPSECIAVEDSPNGVTSAARAGCMTVMVPDLSQPDEELKKLLFAKCESADEIIEIIGKMNG